MLADRLCYKEYMIVPEKMQGSIVHGLAQVFRANKLVFRG